MKMLGDKGEEIAVRYLKSNNYEILERQYRYSRYEIDIICRSDKNILVFIEVKTRSRTDHGHPHQFVSRKKENYIAMAAQHYVEDTGWEDEVRFDIISVEIKKDDHKLEHIKDAFFPIAGY